MEIITVFSSEQMIYRFGAYEVSLKDSCIFGSEKKANEADDAEKLTDWPTCQERPPVRTLGI
jgi:hypothetical protein